MTGTLIYKKWKDMKKRCYNTKSQNYKYYGARGIKVFEEWKNNFAQFYNDVGDLPFEGAE